MEFKCSGCNYITDRKSNIKRHISNIISCNNGIVREIVEIIIDISCEYCKNSFNTIPSMKRHLITCKVKKSNLEEEVKILKEKLAISEALNKKPNTTINNNNIQNNICINLAPWNDPKLPRDVNKYYRESVKKIFLAVPTLIKCIHFNIDHPENHNI